MTEPEPRKSITLTCSGVELSKGRKVSVGFNKESDDRSYYLFFTNEEGEQTKLRVSEEAYNALITLKPYVDLQRDTESIGAIWQAVEAPRAGRSLISNRRTIQ